VSQSLSQSHSEGQPPKIWWNQPISKGAGIVPFSKTVLNTDSKCQQHTKDGARGSMFSWVWGKGEKPSKFFGSQDYGPLSISSFSFNSYLSTNPSFQESQAKGFSSNCR
jgi:hypothetical protein